MSKFTDTVRERIEDGRIYREDLLDLIVLVERMESVVKAAQCIRSNTAGVHNYENGWDVVVRAQSEGLLSQIHALFDATDNLLRPERGEGGS